MTSENDQNTAFDQSADGTAEAQLIHREIPHDRLFGDRGGPYDIDSVAYLAAAVESYQYAREHMRKAARFDGREELLRFSLDKIQFDGLVLEFGVFSGHTINIVAETLGHKTIYGFDSFKGLPEDWTEGAKAGTFAREDLPVVHQNVKLVVGWFDETLRTFLAGHPGDISFLHIDCDLYSSTKTILNEARDRIVSGTVILFDEYFNYPDWKRHEHRAFQEFCYENGVVYEYIGLVPAFEQVAVRILGTGAANSTRTYSHQSSQGKEMPESNSTKAESMHEYKFRTPQELAVSETDVKRILVIGSCLSEALYPHAHKIFPHAQVDYIVYNFPGGDISSPPAAPDQYEFQLIYLPLRTVVPETMHANISHESEEPFIAKFEEAKIRLAQTLDGALLYSQNSNLPTFIAEFITPQQNLIGRLLPRHDFRNPTYFVEQLNKFIHELAQERTNTYVLQTDAIAATFGRKYIQEDFIWSWNHASFANDWDSMFDTKRIVVPTKLSDLYPFNTQNFILAIWSEIDAMYRTIRQQDSVKLVIIDLDDTLWRGVVAEDGLHPYIVEGWPLGMIEALQYLKHRGIVLAIVSKNEEATITDLWPKFLGGRLDLEDFAIRKINWRPKAENIQEILTYTNLLPKNVLFVDDNPVEREAVQAAFPTIRTLGAELYSIRRILLWAPELQVPYISQESSRRTQMIQDQVKRETARSGMSRDDFLASLGVKVSIRKISDITHGSFPRAFELINKSNQFNTTGKRWSIEECSHAFAQGWKFSTFEVQDNYSSYGLVGVAILNGSFLDQFVMSCRVIGLGVENAVIGFLCERSGLSSGRIIETEANLIARDLFQKCGFYNEGSNWVTDGDLIEKPGHVAVEVMSD